MTTTWQLKGNEISGVNVNDTFGLSVDISDNGDVIALSSGINDGTGAVFNYFYNDSIDDWQLKGNGIYSSNDGEQFGYIVKLGNDGNTLAVSATGNDGFNSSVYIYNYNENTNEWNNKGNILVGLTNDLNFGSEISLSKDGDSIAISSRFNDNTTNDFTRVDVYKYNNGTNIWDQKGDPIINLFNDRKQDNAKISLANDNNTLAISLPSNNSGFSLGRAGLIAIYSFNDSSSQYELKGGSGAQAYTSGESQLAFEEFGYSLDLSDDGETMVVTDFTPGGFVTQNYVSVMKNIYSAVLDQSFYQLKSNKIPTTDYFTFRAYTNSKISNDGNTVLVSSPLDNSETIISGIGLIYEFDELGNYWKQKGNSLTSEIANQNDFYGISSSMSADGNTVVVSAYGNDNLKGAVYVYEAQLGPAPCFTAGCLVQTDIGYIKIESLIAGKHTIDGKQILKVPTSNSLNVYNSDYLIVFDENSLGDGIPFTRTVCSPLHKIFYENKMTEAKNIMKDMVDGVYRVPYRKERLYNVQLENYGEMIVNGMKVETLHPTNTWAKISK